MARPLTLSEDRLFPADPSTRDVARRLHGLTRALPVISPHGHTDPEWFAADRPFADATSLLLAYVRALKPLLDRHGDDLRLSVIVFTLHESSYVRELAPLAGHYPVLKLGPAWWFHDSPEGLRRFREQTTETAGFYNTVGFNDDTRAFLSIPARHDVARRMDCGFLARLVVEHRLEEDEAHQVARALTYDLVKQAYKL